MLLYKDYKSKTGKWYTFRPLPLIKREELSRRFNTFDKTISLREQLLLDENGAIIFNIRRILELYDLSLEEFTISEIDDLLINFMLTVNYEALQFEKPVDKSSTPPPDDKDILSVILNSAWGVADSAGDAMYLVNNLPADILLETMKLRSEDLERMYSTDKDRKKKESKKLKEEMARKAKEKMMGNTST